MGLRACRQSWPSAGALSTLLLVLAWHVVLRCSDSSVDVNWERELYTGEVTELMEKCGEGCVGDGRIIKSAFCLGCEWEHTYTK